MVVSQFRFLFTGRVLGVIPILYRIRENKHRSVRPEWSSCACVAFRRSHKNSGPESSNKIGVLFVLESFISFVLLFDLQEQTHALADNKFSVYRLLENSSEGVTLRARSESNGTVLGGEIYGMLKDLKTGDIMGQ